MIVSAYWLQCIGTNSQVEVYALRIRPFMTVNVHDTTVYGAIRSYTEENGDCIRPPCTKTVNDRFFLRISPYVSVYDTEIYDRNTITCKPSYFSVYGRACSTWEDSIRIFFMIFRFPILRKYICKSLQILKNSGET
jgi:hypothetical protein